MEKRGQGRVKKKKKKKMGGGEHTAQTSMRGRTSLGVREW